MRWLLFVRGWGGVLLLLVLLWQGTIAAAVFERRGGGRTSLGQFVLYCHTI